MARLPLHDADDPGLDPVAQRILARARLLPNDSIAPNVLRSLANHPEALQAFTRFANTVYADGSLSPAQRELAYLTASVVNDCHY